MLVRQHLASPRTSSSSGSSSLSVAVQVIAFAWLVASAAFAGDLVGRVRGTVAHCGNGRGFRDHGFRGHGFRDRGMADHCGSGHAAVVVGSPGFSDRIAGHCVSRQAQIGHLEGNSLPLRID